METNDFIRLTSPYVRVNNKQENLDFFQQQLGFKLFSEENSLAFLGGHEVRQPVLTLEESPESRTRAAVGPKKLHSLVFSAPVAEIAELLVRLEAVEQVYRGQKGWAFSVYSPQGDLILLHGEERLEDLEPAERPDLTPNPDFVGLSTVSLSAINLHAEAPEEVAAFYQGLPVTICPIQAEGPDLATANDQTWDLESLEFAVDAAYDLTALQEHFEQLGAETFINGKKTLLVVTAPNKIELWFVK